jgi:very-short-patch-repair endonuclease
MRQAPLVDGVGTVAQAAKVGQARSLRRRSTDAEQHLWALLRDRRLNRFKFKRQLDGSQHANRSANSSAPDAELAARGFEVLRVWNSELSHNRSGVLATIHAALHRRTGDDVAHQ